MMDHSKYEKLNNNEGFYNANEQYTQELNAMFSDSAWDLNDSGSTDEADAKVLRREIPGQDEWVAMGERAIANNMDALRDDYEDKGLSEVEINSVIASDYEDAREELYSDLNEGLDTE